MENACSKIVIKKDSVLCEIVDCVGETEDDTQYTELYGKSGWLYSIVGWTTPDFLTGVYISVLMKKIDTKGSVLNWFYYGCKRNQLSKGIYATVGKEKTKYKMYGADCAISNGGNHIKNGIMQDGDIHNLDTVRSIVRSITFPLHMYVCDIANFSYFSCCIPIAVCCKLCVIRIPDNITSISNFIHIMCEFYNNVEIIRTPWCTKYYLICVGYKKKSLSYQKLIKQFAKSDLKTYMKSTDINVRILNPKITTLEANKYVLDNI